MQLRRSVALTAAALLALTACTDDDDPVVSSPPSTDSVPDAPDTTGEADSLQVVAGEPFPEARCAANEAAGRITYLTGFDYAAAASIVDVIVADDKGYYDDMCLDVEIRPSFSTTNYPLVASGDAQFSSGGSFSEVVAFADANDAEFLVMSVEGRTAIDTLITKAGQVGTLDDLAGTTIGVKGKLPPSIEVMLLRAGLTEGEDFDTVPLEGFDPTAHIAIDAIVGFPGWKSNEPGALSRAGIGHQMFDPLDAGVPGSFGAIYTSRSFVDEHPTAATDFMRATMRGLADAVNDPEAAANTAVELINAGGNPNFLSPEGEVFRWTTDAKIVTDLTPIGTGLGVPDAALLQAELDAYAEVDLFGEGVVPNAASWLAIDIMDALYDGDGAVIWPA